MLAEWERIKRERERDDGKEREIGKERIGLELQFWVPFESCAED